MSFFWQTAKITNIRKSSNLELSKMTGVQNADEGVRRVGGERRVNKYECAKRMEKMYMNVTENVVREL
jgi:hypothetical protein